VTAVKSKFHRLSLATGNARLPTVRQKNCIQGVGPLYMRVFKELLHHMLSEPVLGYLDDIAMGYTTSIVSYRDFISVEESRT